jgi:DNA repair exonuclease SbcCD ATPase subunit
MQPVRLAGTGGPTQVPGTVKAYAIRRWIDPVDHRTVHEAGVVYRQEEDPRWNLQPQNRVVYGPTARRDPHYSPGLASQELRSEIERQRRVTAALEQKLERLQSMPSVAPGALQNADALVHSAQQIEQNQEALGKKLDQLNADNAEIRRRINQIDQARNVAARAPEGRLNPPSAAGSEANPNNP